MNVDYKINQDSDIINSKRAKNFLNPEEEEIRLPTMPVEEIYDRLMNEIENPDEDPLEILRYIILAQYYLNDPNIGENESFRAFIRNMRNIIIDENDRYSITIRIDAIYLIDKFMEHDNEESIHYIQELEMADGFLTLFEETDEIKLLKLLFRFFWLIAGHCDECHFNFVGHLINHQQVFDKIEYYIKDPDQEDIKKHCVLFLKNLVKFHLNSEYAISCTSYFLHIILENKENPPPTYFINSVYGLCSIIQNHKNEVWREEIQNYLTDKIADMLSIEYHRSIYAFLHLIYHYYSRGELFEDFDFSIIINFLTYEDESISYSNVESIRFIAAEVIGVLTSRGQTFIEPLIEKGILDAVLLIYLDSNYKIKNSILTFCYLIAKEGSNDDRRQMVDLGYLNLFVESIDVSNEEMTCINLKGINYLFQSYEEDNYNICIDLIQQIPGYEIIFEIASNEDDDTESTQIASWFTEQYFNDYE